MLLSWLVACILGGDTSNDYGVIVHDEAKYPVEAALCKLVDGDAAFGANA